MGPDAHRPAGTPASERLPLRTTPCDRRWRHPRSLADLPQTRTRCGRRGRAWRGDAAPLRTATSSEMSCLTAGQCWGHGVEGSQDRRRRGRVAGLSTCSAPKNCGLQEEFHPPSPSSRCCSSGPHGDLVAHSAIASVKIMMTCGHAVAAARAAGHEAIERLPAAPRAAHAHHHGSPREPRPPRSE